MIRHFSRRTIASCLTLAGALALAGCSAPVVETTRSVTTYDVTGLSFTAAADATVAAVRARSSGAQVQRSVLPPRLPAEPGALEVRDALAGTRLGALTGGALLAQCDGSPAIIRASDSSFVGYGESTGYTVCLWPYQRGIRVDITTASPKRPAACQPQALGNNWRAAPSATARNSSAGCTTAS